MRSISHVKRQEAVLIATIKYYELKQRKSTILKRIKDKHVESILCYMHLHPECDVVTHRLNLIEKDLIPYRDLINELLPNIKVSFERSKGYPMTIHWQQ